MSVCIGTEGMAKKRIAKKAKKNLINVLKKENPSKKVYKIRYLFFFHRKNCLFVFFNILEDYKRSN